MSQTHRFEAHQNIHVASPSIAGTYHKHRVVINTASLGYRKHIFEASPTHRYTTINTSRGHTKTSLEYHHDIAGISPAHRPKTITASLAYHQHIAGASPKHRLRTNTTSLEYHKHIDGTSPPHPGISPTHRWNITNTPLGHR